MKIVVYSLLDTEKMSYVGLEEKYGVNFIFSKEAPSMENIALAKNADAVSVITTPITADLIEAFYKEGVRYISTRSIGYDHIDIKKAKEIGIGVGNSEYSPDSVAEYTVMLMLMAEKNIKTILSSYGNQDFSLRNVQGSLLKNLTVGILGTGKIGMQVAKMLQGFNCRLIAYSRHEKAEMKGILTYVSLEELYSQSDIISLHMPATEENYHIINKESIASMKREAIIINTARGALIDTEALIEALENGKISGVALDVIEDETPYYYKEFKNTVIAHRNMAILKAMPNVILTPHTAFHTKQASYEIVENMVASSVAEIKGDNNPLKVV